MHQNNRECLFLLLAVTAALLSPACAQPGQQTDVRFTLQGVVVNSVTGRPIPRALVQIPLTPQKALLTGAEGEFSFNNVSPGNVVITVSKPGFFAPGSTDSRGSFSQRTTSVGPDTGRLVLKLIPEAVIFGQVTGPDEEPVEGARIEVLASRMVHGQQELIPAHRRRMGFGPAFLPWVRTDEDGNFRLSGLPPGNYYVLVNTTNLPRRGPDALAFAPGSSGKESTTYPAVVYHPGVTDFDSATPILLAAGQHLELDFSLKKVPAFKISGTLSAGPEWKQVGPPMLVEEDDQHLFTPDAFDAELRTFEFKSVPAGTYTLRLSGSDQNGISLAAYRKLNVDGPAAGLKLALPGFQDIPVIVHKEFSKPLPAAHCTTTSHNGESHISDCTDYPPVMINLLSAQSHRSGGGVGFGPQPDPNNLKLQSVMPGRYRVRAFARFGGYIASLRCGSMDLLRDELVVPEEGGVPPIEVTLRDDSASVKLQLRSDGSAKSVWAVLVPDLFSLDPVVLNVTSGTDRDYGGLPPGDYKVFAFDSMEGINPSDPESLAKYADKATRITLTANGSTTVALDPVRTGD